MSYYKIERFIRFVPMRLSKPIFYTMLRLNWAIPFRLWKLLNWHNVAIAFIGNYFHKYERYVTQCVNSQLKKRNE